MLIDKMLLVNCPVGTNKIMIRVVCWWKHMLGFLELEALHFWQHKHLFTGVSERPSQI